MGGVAIKARRVATDRNQLLAGGEFGAIVKSGRGGAGEFEMVPSAQNTVVVVTVVVEVGVHIVEAPVGDSDNHVLACIGLG